MLTKRVQSRLRTLMHLFCNTPTYSLKYYNSCKSEKWKIFNSSLQKHLRSEELSILLYKNISEIKNSLLLLTKTSEILRILHFLKRKQLTTEEFYIFYAKAYEKRRILQSCVIKNSPFSHTKISKQWRILPLQKRLRTEEFYFLNI